MNKYQLSVAGINAAEGIRRFGGVSEFYEKYLRKFPSDENYCKLKAALSENKVEEAFRYAHALKGLAGNLSLEKLYDALCPFVEKLRGGSAVRSDEFIASVEPIYNAAVTAISAQSISVQ